MAKIAALVPKTYMAEYVDIVSAEENIPVESIKVIETADSIIEARNAIENGATILIARGLQAAMIKKYTKIPLAEIEMTGQEIALLIKEAMDLVQKEMPKIAFIGHKSLFSDTSYMENVFPVELHFYHLNGLDEIDALVHRAVADKNDIIIGGDTVHKAVKRYNIPYLFLQGTDDSIRNALHLAKKLGHTADLEKSSHAQFETILYTVFNGIIKVNTNQEIIAVNRMIEDLLKKEEEELIGKKIADTFELLNADYIEDVMLGKRDSYTTSVTVRDIPLMITTAPIQYDNQITGAILSFNKMNTGLKSDRKLWTENYLSGYSTKVTFDHIITQSAVVKNTIELAKIYALSKSPVLIYGETGTEKELFAQSIHNNSSYRNGPFLSVNCSGIDEKAQIATLFGSEEESGALKKGALEMANYGTLLIRDIENLSPVCQYRLLRLLQYKVFMPNDIEETKILDIRIIVTSHKSLAHYVKKGNFREDLYYLLSSMTLQIPPLRQRKEDVLYMLELSLARFNQAYTKYTSLSQGAKALLSDYSWEGNVLQLERFCERLVLTAKKRVVDEVQASELLCELYPTIRLEHGEEKVIVYQSPEAIKITEILEKHHGNRNLAAKELGISTTTLWRKMKKHGISGSYVK